MQKKPNRWMNDVKKQLTYFLIGKPVSGSESETFQPLNWLTDLLMNPKI